MRFALVDLQVAGRKANREHTGGFGSYMRAEGGFGRLLSHLKSRVINLPITSFAYTQAMLRSTGHTVKH